MNSYNWLANFETLKAHVAQTGHFLNKHTRLNNWCRYQRKRIKEGTMPKVQKVLFEALVSLQNSLLGLSVSVSFGYAAWRSTKVETMAIASWKLHLEEHGKNLSEYPPINLITKEIINHKIDDIHIGAAEWNKKIFNKMYNAQRAFIDRRIYGLEFLFPYCF